MKQSLVQLAFNPLLKATSETRLLKSLSITKLLPKFSLFCSIYLTVRYYFQRRERHCDTYFWEILLLKHTTFISCIFSNSSPIYRFIINLLAYSSWKWFLLWQNNDEREKRWNLLFWKGSSSSSRGLAKGVKKCCCNSAMTRSAKFLSLAQEKRVNV